MSRRAQSTSAQVATAQPFQLYHENISGGKHFEGAKRHLRWRFGWTDSDLEHEVNLKHSLTSGKKVVIEDGREVTTSVNIFATEFSHGWISNGHMFRVELSMSLSEDPVYVFSIDGVRFEDFMRRPANFGTKRTELPRESAFSSSSSSSVPQRRAEEAPARKPAASPAPAPSSTSFDPFSSGSSAPANAFDPFSGSAPAKAAAPSSASFDAFAPPAQQTSSAPAFDAFSSPAKPAASASTFDAFSSPAQPVSASTFDAFAAPAPSSKPAASSFDPFGPSAAPAAAAADPFATSTPAPKAASFDPFGVPAAPAPAAAKRNSAVDIMGDFAGLEYVAPPPQPVSVMLQDNNKQIGSSPAPANQAAASASADPWSSLVNLDLNAPAASAQRTNTVSSGPSLNSQIKTSGGGMNASSASFSMPAAANNDPFGMTSPAPLNPFGGPAMGGMGAAPRPMGAGGMGMGMGGMPMGGGMGGMGMGGAPAAPINPFGGPSMGGPAPMGMGGMGGMGGGAMPAMGAGMGMSSMGIASMGQQQQFGRPGQQPAQSKSSLDSLDWKM